MSTAKTKDPLTAIPSAEVVRRRLNETEGESRKLRILLEIAERIEGVDRSANEGAIANAS